jgi:hypothetical protein
MENRKIKKKARGNLPLHLLVLNQVQSGETNVSPLDNEQINEFMKGEVETAETVQRETINAETVPEKDKVVNAAISVLSDGFQEWLNEVRIRPKNSEKTLVYLNPDVVDIFLLLKKSFKIPLNHIINCVLTDWIESNNDDLKELMYAKQSKNILK